MRSTIVVMKCDICKKEIKESAGAVKLDIANALDLIVLEDLCPDCLQEILDLIKQPTIRYPSGEMLNDESILKS